MEDILHPVPLGRRERRLDEAMKRSLRLLFFAVLVPGALTHVVYGALRSDRAEERRVVRVSAVEVSAVPSVPSVPAPPVAPRPVPVHVASSGCAARNLVLTLPAEDLSRLRMVAGAGSLTVTGEAGRDEVRVEASACASSAALLEELDVTLTRDGSDARIETRYPRIGGWGSSRYARLDLEVHVPEGMAASIDDGGGDVEIRGLGHVDLRDSSGGIVVRDIEGDLSIEDGSGFIEVRSVEGEVRVVDGSGPMSLVGVAGSVTLTDGSGSMEVRDVAGHVRVRTDGSGDIRAVDVMGNLEVASDGSGSLEYAGIGGRVDVPTKHRRR